MFQAIILFCERANIDIKVIKYLFVGSLNTLICYLLYSLCIFCNLHYSIATFISNFLAVIIAFFTTSRIVFNSKDNSLIFGFIFVYFLTWLNSVLFLYIANLIGFTNMYIAGFLLILPSALISFILMKYFVFRKKLKNEEN